MVVTTVQAIAQYFDLCHWPWQKTKFALDLIRFERFLSFKLTYEQIQRLREPNHRNYHVEDVDDKKVRGRHQPLIQEVVPAR